MFMSIRIGIFGYGNIGKGIECAVKQNNDMELVKEEFFTSDRFHIRLKIRSYESYMIKFKQDA